MDARPPILDVVSNYVQLRRFGREHVGLCPFHPEKTPSFYVNDEKEVAHCFGCQWSGNVFNFIMEIEGVDFKGALAFLGLANKARPTKAEITKRETLRRTSKNLTAWALNVADGVTSQLREVGQRAHMAQTILRDFPGEADKELMRDEIARASREWAILEVFQEDLLNPKTVPGLWRERQVIKKIVGDEISYTPEELEGVFPPLTDEYRQRLKSYVEGHTT